MTAKDILAFQFGRADAIRTVASSSSAIWTGIVLVLLTAFARNYDQTYIPEKPFLWFFGPLLFSLVSGTWLYMVCYLLSARRLMNRNEVNPSSDSAWRGFMGTFWMTAPIAWLYAIPVERFFDSLTAAKVNVALLAIVSLWRVLLMARVFQVVCRVPYVLALLWVLAAAFVEVLVVTFFGGAFSKSLMASMGGMRNSPEENVLLNALGFASMVAFWGVLIIGLAILIWRWNGTAEEWPKLRAAGVHWVTLGIFAAGWIAICVPAQIELKRNFTVEQFVTQGKMRAALDYLNQRQPDDFAPARPLPPKLYELYSASQCFHLASVMEPSDQEWVRKHVVRSLDISIGSLAFRYRDKVPLPQVEPHLFGFGIIRFGFDPSFMSDILKSERRAPEVASWLQINTNFLIALRVVAKDPPTRRGLSSEDEQIQEWRELAAILDAMGITNRTYPASAAKP